MNKSSLGKLKNDPRFVSARAHRLLHTKTFAVQIPTTDSQVKTGEISVSQRYAAGLTGC